MSVSESIFVHLFLVFIANVLDACGNFFLSLSLSSSMRVEKESDTVYATMFSI